MTRPRSILAAALPCLLAASAAAPPPVRACHTYDHAVMLEHMGVDVPAHIKEALHRIPLDRTVVEYERLGATQCVDGQAAGFDCSNVDLLAALAITDIGGTGGTSGNDIWGWTDPVTGHEWALVGLSNGTSFVDVTDPVNPVYVARLPTQTSNSGWRDIKVYGDHVFIVSEASSHGMQVFDLAKLRNVINPPVVFSTTTDLAAHYDDFGNAHNLAINEETGFAYAVGTSTCGFGGLHMVNIQNPSNPTFAGCYGDDGYTHDVQCVVYHGPDSRHEGDEVCFAFNEDTVTIVDVSNKMAPQLLSITGYDQDGYVHQGWLTEDHGYLIHDDELDESFFGHNTWTYVWDVSDLEAPVLVNHFESSEPSIDHNQYIRDGFSYQSNYRAGLRILRIVDPSQGVLEEAGFFDTYPGSNEVSFSGTWSNYPYLESGNVIVSDMQRGLFVLRPRLAIFADGFESGDLAAWSQVVP